MPICKKCGKEKDASEFRKANNVKCGHSAQCKECHNAVGRARYDKLSAEERRAHHQEAYQKNKEQVLKYQAEYREANKEKVAERHRVYAERNKEKLQEYRKVYRETHKEEIAEKAKALPKEKTRQYHRTSYLKRRDKILTAVKAYRKSERGKEMLKRNRKKNLKKQGEYVRIWRRKMYRTSPAFRAMVRCRRRMSRAMESKSASTIELIGCSPVFLADLLQGVPEGHDIDHIIPLIVFDLTQESHQRAACNYRNLQLLTMEENRSKGGRWDGTIRQDYREWLEATYPDVLEYLLSHNPSPAL